MNRRAFVSGTLALLAAPVTVHGQAPGKPARIGLLYGTTPTFAPESDPYDRALAAGLLDHGYVAGQNLVIEFRSALGQIERNPALAAELVALGVELIITTTDSGVRAIRETSRTVPIVMWGLPTDPVAAGWVQSLAHPGGTVTGIIEGDLAAKRVELLKETVPRLRSIAAFHADPALAGTGPWLRATEAAAHRLGLAVHPVPLLGVDPGPWQQAFQTVARRGIGAATIQGSTRYEAHRQLLADLALQYRLPMVGTFRAQAEAGGLMSFEADTNEVAQRVGDFAARILKGAKPADLPVEQPTKFELVINRKTAKALGLTIPPSMLARADEVIQ